MGAGRPPGQQGATRVSQLLIVGAAHGAVREQQAGVEELRVVLPHVHQRALLLFVTACRTHHHHPLFIILFILILIIVIVIILVIVIVILIFVSIIIQCHLEL